jgi:hypothetical protein
MSRIVADCADVKKLTLAAVGLIAVRNALGFR